MQSSLLSAGESEAGSSEQCTEVLCSWERQGQFSPTHTHTPTHPQDLYLRDIPVQESTHFLSAWHSEEALELHDSACVCSKLTCKLYEFYVSLQSEESSFSVPSADMIQKHRARASLRLHSETQCLVFAEVFPALRV